MKSGELKDKVAGSVAWSIAEKAGSMLLQMGVSIIVARHLSPDDYGMMAVLTVFSAVALMLVDSGFSQALIRGAEPSDEDYKSVFGFNLAMSAGAYVLLTAASPALAAYYDAPMLARIAPVLFLLLPVNALGVIQNTILTRRFRFDTISKIVFTSSLASGLLAVAMAMGGCGVWSLVGQRLAQMAVKSALLWRFGGWRPSAGLHTEPLKRLSPFGLRLLATDLSTTLFNNLPALFVGRLYSVTTLGFFNQAQKLKELPVSSTTQAVQNVTFPALSNIDGDGRKFAESYRQIIMVVSFAMFPVMTGLSAVAEDTFALLLGEKWMPTVPYFEAICLTGLFAPLASVALNVVKVRSDGRAIVRAEIVKKTAMAAILAATIPAGVMALTWGLVAAAAVEMAVNVVLSTRFSEFTAGMFIRTVAPSAAVSAAMYAAVRMTLSAMAAAAVSLRLAAGIAVGAAVYTALAAAFRLEAVAEVRAIVRKLFTGK